MDRKLQLRGIYGRLIGIKSASGNWPNAIFLPASFGKDFDDLVDAFQDITKENGESFKIPQNGYSTRHAQETVNQAELDNKISQLLNYTGLR